MATAVTTPILLIEDDLELARATTRWLRRTFADALVIHTTDAAKAIQLITDERNAWQLIVSDYNLDPGGNGGDVLRAVQTIAPELSGRFVFFSSSSKIRAWRKWLEKPANYEAFAEKMREACGSNETIMTDADKLARCVGCRDDFYNGKNPPNVKRCWSFADAKPVTRWRLATWTKPTVPRAFVEVATLACHYGEGYVHYNELPDFAIDPIRLRVVPEDCT